MGIDLATGPDQTVVREVEPEMSEFHEGLDSSDPNKSSTADDHQMSE